MSRTRKVLARARGAVVLAALAMAVIGAGRQAIPQRPRPRRFANGRPDTTIVLQPSQLTVAGANISTEYGWTFSTDTSGFRHTLRIVNGNGAANLVSSGSIVVNNQYVISSTDLNSTVDSLKRVVWPDTNGAVDAAILGPANSFITVEVFRTPDPNYPIWGPQSFTEPSSGPVTQSYHFTLPSGAQAPYTIHIANGNSDGSHRVANATVWVNGVVVFDQNSFGLSVATRDRDVAVHPGSSPDNQVTVRIANPPNSTMAITFTATDVTPPVLAFTSPPQNLLTVANSVVLAGSVTDETLGSLYVNGVKIGTTPGAFANTIPLPSDGTYVFDVQATNRAGYTTDSTLTVVRAANGPVVNLTQPGAAIVTTTSATYTVKGSWSDTAATTATLNGTILGTPAPTGTFSQTINLALGANAVVLAARDTLGRTAQLERSIIYEPNTAVIPEPTPTPLSQTELDSFQKATHFLYPPYGNTQTGLDTTQLDAERVAVIRGRVVEASSLADTLPLAGVTVSVVGHPEFGSTVSRTSGNYDLVVNGGGAYTLAYARSGFIPVQRVVQVSWRDYTRADDVALRGYDTRVTTVTTGTAAVVTGSIVSDASGARQAAILFPTGLQAKYGRASGDSVTLSTMAVRATEYTVGMSGPKAMPAALPPMSEYTYCVELSVDGEPRDSSRTVVFSNPVPFYVDNFLGFTPGEHAPVGSYDHRSGMWVGEVDGRVLKYLGASGGVGQVSADTTNTPATAAVLNSLGFTTEELQQLATLGYAPGHTFWRVRLGHFSSWDVNWPFVFAGHPRNPDAKPPKREDPGVNHCANCPGSTILPENQTLVERIPVTGTPYDLAYSSDRVKGYRAPYQIRVPLTTNTVADSLKAVQLEITVGGRQFRYTYPNTVSQTVVWNQDGVWDGTDAYGRPLVGTAIARVRVGFTYPNKYWGAGASPTDYTGINWMGPPKTPNITTDAGRSAGTIWAAYDVIVGTGSNAYAGLGGWSITPHHFYDGNSQTVYLGDGTRLEGRRVAAVVEPAGAVSGTPVLADFALFPDGGIACANGNRVVKLNRSGGHDSTIAGGGAVTNADGVPATNAALSNIFGVATGPDGSVYIIEQTNPTRITRVTPDGIIHKIAGNGTSTYSGDGGPATSAGLHAPNSIAVASDGTVYFTEASSPLSVIRRITPDGRIDRFAGVLGTTGSSPTDTLATLCPTNIGLGRITVGPDGTVYFVEVGNSRVCSINAAGRLHVIATRISNGRGITLGADGTVCVANGSQVLGIAGDGDVLPISGTLVGGNGPSAGAQALSVNWMNGAVTSIAETGENTVKLMYSITAGTNFWDVVPVSPGFSTTNVEVASPDASELYVFSTTGRHLRTLDALTGAVRYAFTYDSTGSEAGLLALIRDPNNQTTQIIRDANGVPTQIIAPFGQTTNLALQNGSLQQVTNPKSESVTLGTGSSDGLLTSLTDARNFGHQFTYDALGRLSRDAAPDSMTTTISRATLPADATGDRTLTLTSKEGRATKFEVDLVGNPTTETRSVTAPDGLQQIQTLGPDGGLTLASPDSANITAIYSADPRAVIGFQAPVAQLVTMTRPNPSSPAMVVQETRTGSVPDSNFTDIVKVNGRSYETDFRPNVGAGGLNLLKFTPPSGVTRQVQTTTDQVGRPHVTTVPGLASITAVYDAAGRESTLTIGTRTWSYSYDSRGRLASVTDPQQQMTQFTYDDADRLASEVLPADPGATPDTVRFTFDPNGNLTSLTPPGRPAHAFAYTPGDETRLYDPPDVPDAAVDSTHYSYNQDRQLTQLARPDTQAVTLGYPDATGRLGSVTQPRGSASLSYYPAGPSAGHLETLGSPDGVTLTFGYDGALPISEAWDFGGGVTSTVSHDYDANLWEKSETVQGTGGSPSTASYFYDGTDGLLQTANLPGTQALTLQLTQNLVTGLLTGTQLDSVATSAGYNAYAELMSAGATFGSGGQTLYAATYGRDSLGRVVRLREVFTGATTDRGYSYDARGRLVAVRDSLAHADVARYAYDGNGNRTQVTDAQGSRTGTFDAQDRLKSLGSTSYTYGSNGERRTATNAGGVEATTYDALGNLTKVVLASGDSVEYAVDGRNRRVGRKLDGVLTQRWVYGNELSVVAELDASGALRKRFVYGSQDHVPDAMVVSGTGGVGDSTYRLVTDQLGSVRLVVNAATGYVAERLDYDAWGVVTQDTHPGFTPFGYAGGLYDATTGLVRFGARDYDPASGVWLSKDPIRFDRGSTGTYLYVDDDPADFTDVRGLWRYYGNWGGPHWTNGTGTWSETGHFPHLPGQQGYRPPLDARDELYREHDLDIMRAARIADRRERRKRRREADFDLAVKLARFQIDNPCANDWLQRDLEFWLFFTPLSRNNNEDKYVP